MCVRIGGKADEAKRQRDHENGGSKRKMSQDISMNLKQLSIEITEMSSMSIKWIGGTHNQVTQVI